MNLLIKGNKMKKNIYRSEDRGKANYGWLDTKYSFSFANYYNPQNDELWDAACT